MSRDGNVLGSANRPLGQRAGELSFFGYKGPMSHQYFITTYMSYATYAFTQPRTTGGYYTVSPYSFYNGRGLGALYFAVYNINSGNTLSGGVIDCDVLVLGER